MSMSKLVKIALALAASGFILLLAGNLLGGRGIVVNSKFQIGTVDDLKYYEYENRDMEAFASVDIKVGNIPVTFLPSGDGTYGIETAYNSTDRDNMIIEVRDKRLTVRKKNELFLFSFDFSFFNRSNSNQEFITVYLPQKEYERIEVSTSNSSVTIEETGIIVEDLVLDTSNSVIRITDINADRVMADTSNGAVYLKNVSSKKVRVNTSNAGVTVSNSAVDALSIDTSDGAVELDGLTFENKEGDFSIDTSNASIAVYFPEGSEKDFRIKADTSNADIYINERNLKDDDYSFGKGENRLRLTTSNGRIEMSFGLD